MTKTTHTVACCSRRSQRQSQSHRHSRQLPERSPRCRSDTRKVSQPLEHWLPPRHVSSALPGPPSRPGSSTAPPKKSSCTVSLTSLASCTEAGSMRAFWTGWQKRRRRNLPARADCFRCYSLLKSIKRPINRTKMEFTMNYCVAPVLLRCLSIRFVV